MKGEIIFMYAINFAMTDVYGGFAGTTEATVPEENDKKVLVDEVTNTAGAETPKKSFPIYLAIICIIVFAFIMGAVK